MSRKAVRRLEVDETFRDWVVHIGFDREMAEAVGLTGILSGNVAESLRNFVSAKLDQDCLKILNRVLTSSDGWPVETFGFDPSEVQEMLENEDCACARLVKLGLLYVDQQTARFRPTAASSHELVASFVGI